MRTILRSTAFWRTIAITLGFGILLFVPWLFSRGIQEREFALATAEWPTATGEILDSRVGDRITDTDRYEVFVDYEYVVGEGTISETTYKGDTVTVRFYLFHSEPKRTYDEDTAIQIVDRYPQELPVDVYYNPELPTQSVLEPGTPPSWAYIFGLTLELLAAGSALLILGFIRFPKEKPVLRQNLTRGEMFSDPSTFDREFVELRLVVASLTVVASMCAIPGIFFNEVILKRWAVVIAFFLALMIVGLTKHAWRRRRGTLEVTGPVEKCATKSYVEGQKETWSYSMRVQGVEIDIERNLHDHLTEGQTIRAVYWTKSTLRSIWLVD